MPPGRAFPPMLGLLIPQFSPQARVGAADPAPVRPNEEHMFAAAAVTLLLLLAPGAIIGIAAGLRPMPALAAAGPVILGVAGFGAWAAGALDVRWGWIAFLASFAGAAAVAYLARAFIPRADSRASGRDGESPFARPSAAEWATAAVSAAVTVVGSARYLLPMGELPGGGSNLREAWDLHWHNNFLRWIAEEGIASPTRAGELMNRETAADMFYPAAWHALGGLVPGDPILLGNVYGAVAPMVLLPAGAAYLAWVVAGPRWAVIAAPAAAVASIALPEITGSLMITASLPYLLAVAAIPATMALVITGRTVAAVPALAGVFLAHPAAAVALAVFALAWWLTRPSPAALLRLAITALVVAAPLMPILIGATGQGESVAEYSGQIGLERAESLWWTVTGQSNHTQKLGWYPPAVVLALIGAVVLLFRRRPWTPWPVLALIVLGVVSDSAQARWADPVGEWLRVLGTFFYDMAYRIQAPMGVLRLVCIGVAVAWLVDVVVRAASAVRRRRSGGPGDSRDDGPSSTPHDRTSGRRRRATAAILAAAVAAVALVPVAWATGDDARTSVLASRGSTYVSGPDRRAMEWLAEQPDSREGNVLVNPSEGSGWMYALHGLPSLFMHFHWPDADSDLSAKALNDVDLAGSGVPGDPRAVNEVDVALRKLGVRYLYVSPPSASGAGGAALASKSWAFSSPGLTQVYRDGPVAIFAVDAMHPRGQVERILADSPHPPPRPDPARTPHRQPIIAAPTDQSRPLAGAVIGVRSGSGDVTGDLGEDFRLAGDPSSDGKSTKVGRETSAKLADAVAAELRRRGATPVLLDEAGAGTGAGFDAVVNVGVDAEGVGHSGVRVTGLYPGTSGFESRRTADLAGGVRDSLVFHRFSADSRYDEDGRRGYVADGLAPAFRVPPTTGAPEIIASAGNIENPNERKALSTREWRERFGQGIADGIAAMLRQH